MRFSLLAVASAFATSVLAQTNGFMPFITPAEGSTLTAGSKFKIQWQPTQPAGSISLILLQGKDANTLELGNTVASGIPSTQASYDWTVPSSAFPTYGLKLQLDSNTTIFQYSFPFKITGASGSSSTVSASTSGSSLSSTRSASTVSATSGVATSTTTAMAASTSVTSSPGGGSTSVVVVVPASSSASKPSTMATVTSVVVVIPTTTIGVPTLPIPTGAPSTTSTIVPANGASGLSYGLTGLAVSVLAAALSLFL